MSDFNELDDFSEEDSEVTEPMTLREWMWDVFVTWGPAIFAVLFLRSAIAEPFRIPSGSMVPTLAIGDHILVTKYSYGFRIPLTRIPIGTPDVPERGDVVVFVKPNATQDDFVKKFDLPFPPFATQDFVKRVIGIPGDKVKVVNNVIYLNGVVQEKKQEGPFKFVNQSCHQTNTVEYTETVDGKDHAILNNARFGSRVGDYPETTIPDGHVFVMGDNRDNSSDSRVWGFVPVQNIKGKARFIWLSLKTCGTNSVFGEVRGERFGIPIR